MMASMRSVKLFSSRDRMRRISDSVIMGADIFRSIASITVQRPSPEPATEAGALMGSAEAGLPLDHPLALNAVTHDTPAGPLLSATWSFAPALVSEAEASPLVDAWSQALAALARHAARPQAGGLTPSDLELVALEQSEIETFERQHPGLEDIWPLTPLQEGLLFHAHYDREGEDPYLVQLALELEGELDPARLRQALDALLRRHPNLRVSFQRNRRDARCRSCTGAAPCPGGSTI